MSFPVTRRFSYLSRIASVYLFPSKGPLAFWYETPEVNTNAFGNGIGEYYMTFRGKSTYRGPFDEKGVPLLNYRGNIGLQYNPIAIAQYGLACYNRYRDSGTQRWRDASVRAADWLVANLEPNGHDIPLWHHRFDWPYRQTLKAPWGSGLAQGTGISLLIRAAQETGRADYADAARAAFLSFSVPTDQGGVVVRDPEGHLWIEEYIVTPPTHILNGFLWALWGVHDFARWSQDREAGQIFGECVETLACNLQRYDAGFWSLYELPDGTPPMLASRYYHGLHVVQLAALYRMTGREVFRDMATRWSGFLRNPVHISRAFIRKAAFKLKHY